jgi:hypothetical protein
VITSLFYPALAIYFSHQPLSHFSTRILDSLFLPSANDAFHHNDLHDFWQGYDALKIRTDAAARARCGTEHTVRVERLFIPSTIPDPFGALNLQTLLPTLNLQTNLESRLTPELPCVRLLDDTSPATPPSHKCLVVSPTAHWSDDANIIATDPHLYTSLNKAQRNVSRGGIPLTAEMALAGRLTTDHAGYGSIIESSKFLSVSFFFREDDCHANAGHDTWMKLVESSVPDGVEVVRSSDQPKLLALEACHCIYVLAICLTVHGFQVRGVTQGLFALDFGRTLCGLHNHIHTAFGLDASYGLGPFSVWTDFYWYNRNTCFNHHQR